MNKSLTRDQVKSIKPGYMYVHQESNRRMRRSKDGFDGMFFRMDKQFSIPWTPNQRQRRKLKRQMA